MNNDEVQSLGQPEASTPSNVNTAQAAAPSSVQETPASASAGIEAPALVPHAHPHYALIHGTTVIIENLIKQMETVVAEECHDAINHMHLAWDKLKSKISTEAAPK